MSDDETSAPAPKAKTAPAPKKPTAAKAAAAPKAKKSSAAKAVKVAVEEAVAAPKAAAKKAAAPAKAAAKKAAAPAKAAVKKAATKAAKVVDSVTHSEPPPPSIPDHTARAAMAAADAEYEKDKAVETAKKAGVVAAAVGLLGGLALAVVKIFGGRK